MARGFAIDVARQARMELSGQSSTAYLRGNTLGPVTVTLNFAYPGLFRVRVGPSAQAGGEPGRLAQRPVQSSRTRACAAGGLERASAFYFPGGGRPGCGQRPDAGMRSHAD
ncbi:MAG TPA: hypothetical protein VMB03_26020 [Bryobacteraceae bacterium]|nr:hypothetical protein [Bryobacteraceae bacterium]